MTIVNVRGPSEAPDAVAKWDLVWGTGGRITTHLTSLSEGLPHPLSPSASDLLTFAISAYVADKVVRRDAGADRWTRDIELRVPLSAPDAWPTALSERLLTRLTGDTWTVVGRPVRAAVLPWQTTPALDAAPGPRDVSLLSGGLDSVAYLAETVSAGGSAEFIGHTDANARISLQRNLYSSLVTAPTTVGLRQFRIEVHREANDPREWKEPSTRARAVAFVAAAVAAAVSCGAASVTVPENGFVSINMPLGLNRIGSLSTRTTHPTTIADFQHLLDATGIGVVLATPYALLTKGEVVARGRTAGLSDMAIAESISCARPLQGGWKPYGNCGYCYACLVRRASLEASGGDPTKYRHDPRISLHDVPGGAEDFRALATALRRPLTPTAPLAAGPLPPGFDIAGAWAMLDRGREELRGMIEQSLSRMVRTTIGW